MKCMRANQNYEEKEDFCESISKILKRLGIKINVLDLS